MLVSYRSLAHALIVGLGPELPDARGFYQFLGLETSHLTATRQAPKRCHSALSHRPRELNSQTWLIFSYDAESKRVPVVLQYSSFDFLKDKAKAIVEAHATEAAERWNV